MKIFQSASGPSGVTMPAGLQGVLPKFGAALVWGAVGLSLAYWGLALWGAVSEQAVPVMPERSESPDSQQVARALGAGASQATTASVPSPARHALIGLATDAAGRGVALIRTDDSPARSYRVGATLPDGMVLLALGPREAGLGTSAEGPVSVRLELPMSSRSVR
jgi:general secretion pathway protein C